MERITTLTSRTITLPQENIDTDQIIPARFLTTTSRQGLGQHAFADWRYTSDGMLNLGFPLNQYTARGAEILVAGRNFGCGSSREHAPWALLDAGIRAVVSTQIADIFRANAARNGLLPIVVDDPTHRWLIEHPGVVVKIDLATRTIAAERGPVAEFPFDPFAQYCLINGVDELGFLMSYIERIEQHEASRA